MTQYEQENDLGTGGGGGEVDAETYQQAWRDADARRGREDGAEDVEKDVERGEKEA